MGVEGEEENGGGIKGNEKSGRREKKRMGVGGEKKNKNAWKTRREGGIRK